MSVDASDCTMLDILQVGEMLAWLRSLPAGTPLKEASGSSGVVDRLEDFVDVIARLQLPDTEQMARNWVSPIARDLRAGSAARLGEAETRTLAGLAGDLWCVLEDEAKGRTVFVVPRDDYARRLLLNPGEIFGLNAQHPWPDPGGPVGDMHDAAVCFAVGRYAATIMFVCKVVEGFARQFCGAILGPHPEKKGLGWFIRRLENPEIALDKRVVQSLRFVLRFRNPAMHPDPRAGRSSGLARTLIKQSAAAVDGMGQYLAKRQPRSDYVGATGSMTGAR